MPLGIQPGQFLSQAFKAANELLTKRMVKGFKVFRVLFTFFALSLKSSR
jgi:hypothetical protein